MKGNKDWFWNLIGMLLFSVVILVINLNPVLSLDDNELIIISPSIDHIEIAEGLIQNFELESAQRSLEVALDLDPENPEANFLLGLIYSITEPEKASGYLDKAADLHPTFQEDSNEMIQTIQKARFAEEEAHRLVQIGQALGKINNWYLAYSAFFEAVSEDPEYSEARAFLGISQINLDLDASESLKTALELDPYSISANVFYAQHLAEQDKPEIGLPFLHTALKLDPENNTLVYELGYYNAAMGNLVEAYIYFEEMVLKEPDDYEPWFQLANFSLNYEYQISQVGLPAARKALLISPGNPEAMILLGRAYSQLGNPDMAIKLISQALQNSPENINALYYLGIITISTGNTAEAESYLQQVIALSSDPELIKQVQFIIDTSIP